MNFVLLLMPSLLQIGDANFNNFVCETSKVLNSNFFCYNMKSVDLSGDRMVVGIRGCNRTTSYRYGYRYPTGYNYYWYHAYTYGESVYIYKLVNNRWITEFKLSNLAYVPAVAIDNSHMAFISGTDGLISVFIFRHVDYTWINQSKFALPEAQYYTIAISNGILVIGLVNYMANSSVYVFTNKGRSWSMQTDLLQFRKAMFSTGYGPAVDVNEYYIVVGGASYSDEGIYSPSVSIFRNEKNRWVEEARISPSNRTYNFGISATIDGDRVAVGDINLGYSPGVVYVYKRVNGNWITEARLVAPDGKLNDFFGYSVSLNGDYLVVGSRLNHYTGYESSAVYVFKYNGLQWVELTKLAASDVKSSQAFGNTVVVDGNYIATGRSNYDDSHSNGSIYTYDINDIPNSSNRKYTNSFLRTCFFLTVYFVIIEK